MRALLRAGLALLLLAGSSAGALGADRAERELIGEEIRAERRSAIVRAAEAVGPSVVTVSVLRTEIVEGPAFSRQREFFYPFLRSLRRRYYRQAQSVGSGVLVRDDGVLLTNFHVVSGARQIRITLPGGREFSAEYVGGSKLYDLAVLKIEGEGERVPAAPLAESGDLLIGEWVIAIGNPFGYLLGDTEPTVTVGVVSAVSRDILPEQEGGDTIYKDMIQTDAAINPGNSGGALVNSVGEVIGINTFIFSSSGGSQGIGFAIPIETARLVMQEILEHGEVRPVWVGIQIQEFDEDLADMLDLGIDRGVIITKVDAGSPSERAGLRRGDVIRTIDGQRIWDYEDARRALYGTLVDKLVEFEVERPGKRSTHVLRLVERR
jgi:serine protease Do